MPTQILDAPPANADSRNVARFKRPDDAEAFAELDQVFASDADWSRSNQTDESSTTIDRSSPLRDRHYADRLPGVSQIQVAVDDRYPAKNTAANEPAVSEFRPYLFLWIGLLCSAFCLWKAGILKIPAADRVGSSHHAMNMSSDAGEQPLAAMSDQPQYKMKSVAAFKKGDPILAYNTSTKKLEMCKVKSAFRKTTYHLRLLTFRDAEGHEQTIKTTNEHEFFKVWDGNPRAGKWVASEKLEVGDEFRGPLEDVATLVATEYEPHPAGIDVYNVEVEGNHNYFVAAHGARGPPVLSHNMECKIPNINGRKGGAAHQAMVDDVIEDIKARKLDFDTEYHVRTPQGKKSSRFMDVVGIDPKTRKVVEVHQVGRGLTSDPSIPVSRERDAFFDVRNAKSLKDAVRVFHNYLLKK
ncbi:MAG: polymorphic toxin-type HINT domain-containing protein [Planctomycetaceae bacterium]